MALVTQLIWPPIVVLLAAFLEYRLQSGPALVLFLGWILIAIDALLLLAKVPDVMRNPVGRLDTGELVTLAWFALLSSALSSGSVLTAYVSSGLGAFNAFAQAPAELWVLAGLALLAKVGVRAASFFHGSGAARTPANVLTHMQQLLGSPSAPSARPRMGNAQYLMWQLIMFLTCAFALGRLFNIVVGETVGEFPEIPQSVLPLVGVSVGDFIAANATPH